MFTKSPPLVTILRQMYPVHTFPPYFPTINSDVLPSVPRSSEWSLPFMFLDQNFVCIHLSHELFMPCPSVLDLLTLIMTDEVY